MPAPTSVYLTVDIECAEEHLARGRIQPPLDYDLRVWGRFANQPEELGLAWLLRCLDRHGLTATFFVEALSARYFGVERLREVCQAMKASGHDIQLHLHPIQRQPTFRTRRVAAVPDDIGDYGQAEQARLLDEGLGILAEAGVPRASVVGFRAGNFGASNQTWAALRDAGLCVSSSYNPCYLHKNCKMRLRRPPLGLFRSPTPGVWELPISCFEEGDGRPRHLQITAISHEEMVDALETLHRMQVGQITIVTHSFEFFFIDDPVRRRGHENTINRQRFERLLDHLDRARDRFRVDTVGRLGQELRDAPAQARESRVRALPRGNPCLRLVRLIEQGRKRVLSYAPW